MTIDELKNNLLHEKEILKQMSEIFEKSPKKGNDPAIFSLKNQLKMLNDSVPSLIEGISQVRELHPGKTRQNPKVSKVSYKPISAKEKRKTITLNKEDREKFVKELSLSEYRLKKIKSPSRKQNADKTGERKIIQIGTKVFGRISNNLAPNFKDLKSDLSQANISVLLSPYLSLGLLVSSIIFVVSLLLIIFLSVLSSSYLIYLWVPFFLLLISFTFFYIYPSLQKRSVEKNLGAELPFATIYMAAIASSNIEPTKLLKIIANSPEYPNISKEIKKILNQIEFYGYDLVNALKNVAKRTKNKKLADLFGGIATNIVSGGSLKNFLEKKSVNLLEDYRRERQKYAGIAETFMDVYISVLITAPLILIMILIIMSVTNIAGGASVSTVMLFAIIGLVLINSLFLIVLNAKQPKI